jgi:penicillin-binding protein 2
MSYEKRLGDFSDTVVEDSRGQPGPTKRRFWILQLMLIVFLFLLTVRGWQLQVVQGGQFRNKAENNRVAKIPLAASRAIIFDANNKQLVENIASTDLVLDPVILPKKEDEAPLIDGLINYTSLSHDDIRLAIEQVRETKQAVVLLRALPHDDVVRIESELEQLPGVRLVSSSVRNYYYPYALAHALGYTGATTREDLEQDSELLLSDTIGIIGLEKQYNKQLQGEHGASYIEVNAKQQPQKDVRTDPPVPGADLFLTIDVDLQDFIFNVLAEQITESEEGTSLAGVVVAIDPRSGAVRALVNYPSYDPNVFSQPGKRADTKIFLREELQPLFNRAISGTYAPGSTIKPLLAAAALEENIITEHTQFSSTGGINIGEWYFPDWKSGGHGLTDVRKALAESVNTFFYIVSGGNDERRGLGVKRINEYLDGFSWGQPTGIDLPMEANGLLPSPEWKEKVKEERWYVGDTYHLGIGQGDVLVTPTQVAVATAALANGGTVFEPYIVRNGQREGRVTYSHESTGDSVDIKGRHIKTVREGMRQAVLSGSARRLSNLPVAIAGKTGTAQVGGTDDTHAWFTSFGPYENPSLVLTVLVERGGAGDKVAIPIAEEIWSWWDENGR